MRRAFFNAPTGSYPSLGSDRPHRSVVRVQAIHQSPMLLYLLSANTNAIAEMDYSDDGSDDVYPLEGKQHTTLFIITNVL
jgi:hypothetical protein